MSKLTKGLTRYMKYRSSYVKYRKNHNDPHDPLSNKYHSNKYLFTARSVGVM